MYTLRLFGTPLIEGPHGPLSGRVAQRRRVALLAVLALAERRTLTRDRLVTMFWPESATDRGRHNLADSVYVIRKGLGPDAVASRGDDLRLDADRVSTDVEAFREALGSGDLDGALSLYAGPFMEGFHVSGAPGFERWVDAERSRLAADHARALEKLTVEAGDEGRPHDALAWARRLVAADPLNTRNALHLMRSLEAVGDRAGAVRHAERHAERLEEELGLDPAPAVAAFARRLQSGGRTSPTTDADPPARADATVARDAPALPAPTASSESTPAPGSARDPDPPARPRTARPGGDREGDRGGARTTGRSRVALGPIGVLMAASLVAWWGSTRDTTSYVADRIVVVDLVDRTGRTEGRRLGRFAANVLRRRLARAEVADVVLPPDVVGSTENGGDDPGTPRDAARRFGADVVVSGTVDASEGATVLSATIAAAGGTRVLATTDRVHVDPSNPEPALDRLASRVLGTVASHLGRDLPEHPYVVPGPSWDAYRTADRATELFLRNRFDSASVLFRRAYELDRTAEGYLLWEAISQENLDRRARIAEILDELRPRVPGLTRFDQAQFDWLEAMQNGDRAGALRAARVAHRLYPHSGLGGFQVGLELLRTGRPRAAVEAFLELDPDRGWLGRYRWYWGHLASAYHHLGRHEEELDAAAEGYARFPTSGLLNYRLRALAALGRVGALRRALRESTDPSGHFLVAARALHRHGRDSLAVAFAEDGLRMLRGVAANDGGRSSTSRSRWTEARLLIAARRYREAHEILDRLLEQDPTDRDLLGWLGVVEARLGRETAARKRIDALGEPGARPWSHGGPTVARAAIHAELGTDPAFVRALLERSHREGWSLGWFHYTPLFDPVRDHADARDFFRPRG